MTIVDEGGQITTLNSDEEKSAGFSDDELRLIQEIVAARFKRTKTLPPAVQSLQMKLKIKLGQMSLDELAQYKQDPLS